MIWYQYTSNVVDNNLFNKHKLNFKTRAIAIQVAMTPLNLRCKYRGRPHPAITRECASFGGRHWRVIELCYSARLAYTVYYSMDNVYDILYDMVRCNVLLTRDRRLEIRFIYSQLTKIETDGYSDVT